MICKIENLKYNLREESNGAMPSFYTWSPTLLETGQAGYLRTIITIPLKSHPASELKEGEEDESLSSSLPQPNSPSRTPNSPSLPYLSHFHLAIMQTQSSFFLLFPLSEPHYISSETTSLSLCLLKAQRLILRKSLPPLSVMNSKSP